MDTYYHIAKNVEPKKKALREAERRLAEMQQLLKEKRDALNEASV